MPQLDATPFVRSLVDRGCTPDAAEQLAADIMVSTIAYPTQRPVMLATTVYIATVDIDVQTGKLVLRDLVL